tara:strand:+ start:1624 stop:2562 length:939 start_codon:yes stop_codon:yes gene_type:complete
MAKNCYVFADGSNESGTGHLRRAQTISQKICNRYETMFLYSNEFQRKFYEDNNLKSINLNELNDYLDGTLIIDTKRNIPELLLSFGIKQKKIYLDHYHKNITKDDLLIFPTFYLNDDTQKNIKSKGICYKFGKEYMLLRDEFLQKPTQNEFNSSHITISFGGTDPNNLSQKTLESLNFKNEKVICIKGKQNKNDIRIPSHLVSNVEIIENTDEIAKIFRSSKLVITAMGTTIQELFFLKKPFALICNYKEDMKDIDSIKENLTKEGLAKLLNFYHYYKDLPKKNNLEIKNYYPKKLVSTSFKQFGTYWDKLL